MFFFLLCSIITTIQYLIPYLVSEIPIFVVFETKIANVSSDDLFASTCLTN